MMISLTNDFGVWYDKFRDEIFIEDHCPITGNKIFYSRRYTDNGGNTDEFGNYIELKRTGFEPLAHIIWDYLGEI